MKRRRSDRVLAAVFGLLLTACGSVQGALEIGHPTQSPISELRTSTPPGAAVSSGEELGLAPTFTPVCRNCLGYFVPPDLYDAMGLKELRSSPYVSGLIPWFRFPVKCFFAFTNAVPPLYLKDNNLQLVYGFSVALDGPQDEKSFDELFIAEFPALEQQTLTAWSSDATPIQGLAVGDSSVGVAARPTVNGYVWALNAVSFRVGQSGGFVFTLYPARARAPEDILRIARLYARHLKP
jgi:hypothetical protein